MVSKAALAHAAAADEQRARRRATHDGKSNGESLIGRFTEKALLQRAKEVVAEKSKTSDIFDEEAEQSLPRFLKSGA